MEQSTKRGLRVYAEELQEGALHGLEFKTSMLSTISSRRSSLFAFFFILRAEKLAADVGNLRNVLRSVLAQRGKTANSMNANILRFILAQINDSINSLSMKLREILEETRNVLASEDFGFVAAFDCLENGAISTSVLSSVFARLLKCFEVLVELLNF